MKTHEISFDVIVIDAFFTICDSYNFLSEQYKHPVFERSTLDM